MYDSRTHKPRIPGTHRYSTRKDRNACSYECCQPRQVMSAREAIEEELAAMQPEYVPERWDINRLHAEALREDERRWNDIQDEAWAWHDEQERMGLLDEDEDDDEGFPEPWMWTLTMTEAREHFGPDFEHNGFQIDSTNAPRRSTPRMKDTATERLQAIEAARAQRERHEKLTTQLYPDGKAKVSRPLPVPNAERPARAPYDKFTGATH